MTKTQYYSRMSKLITQIKSSTTPEALIDNGASVNRSNARIMGAIRKLKAKYNNGGTNK